MTTDRCWERLLEFAPGENRVFAVMNEEGTIHGIVHPKGTKVSAHERCIESVSE